jgi:aminopeptidase-like protein
LPGWRTTSHLIPNLRGGIFMEMTGNQNKIAWHHTRQHDHLLDRITNYVVTNTEHDERDFAAAPANDERVINGPGVNVPCISHQPLALRRVSHHRRQSRYHA